MATRPFRFLSSIRRRMNEMRDEELGPSWDSLRNTLSYLRSGYYEPPKNPRLWGTTTKKDRARSLYYNLEDDLSYGAFLAKPIVDGVADYIGLPVISVRNDKLDDLINTWVCGQWKHIIWQMYRNSLRDSKTWVRLRRPWPDRLLPDDDTNLIEIEVIDADRVTPYRNPATNELIRVEILTSVYVEDQPFDPFQLYATGINLSGREHEIIEIITPTDFWYYDATDSRLMVEFSSTNEWGFVPCVEVFNDYDSALHGGVSELEPVIPFFGAIHELIEQTRNIHKIYAEPKVKMKLDEVETFLRNNYPDAFQNGQFTGRVSWKGRDIFFLEDTDDADFITVTLNTNDSVTLLEFLIDCVCMAAEMTDESLFRAKSEGAQNTTKDLRFKKKIGRKRSNYEIYFARIIQMATLILYRKPMLPIISWLEIEPQDLSNEADSMDRIVSASETANRSGIISRSTYRAKIRRFYPSMKDDAAEDAQAKKEAQEEADQDVKHQKKLSDVKSKNNGNGNGNSPNSATRVRDAFPMDIAPPPASG